MPTAEVATATLHIITEEIDRAIAAPKCHKCGCLHQTVEALSDTEAGRGELADVFVRARHVFLPKAYDCLGCPVCYPAIAANAFAQAWPNASEGLDLCPTEEPAERHGWPPLPGDYTVVRYRAPVAVCALNTQALVHALSDRRPEVLAIVGTMHTENLGIERVIKNTLSNPHIRFLLLCGEDTRQAIGHLPGQSLESLFQYGIDERGRIIGARGKRPILKNVSRKEVETFLRQVELVSMIGEVDTERVDAAAIECARRNPGPYPEALTLPSIERVQASETLRLTLDPAGYFVVYPDRDSRKIVVEHYTNQGVLSCVIEGRSTGALYSEAIKRNLLTRLDHAAYLGRELARAEQSLITGAAFVQDAAPGQLGADQSKDSCSSSSCGCTPEAQPTTSCCSSSRGAQ